MSDMDKIFAKFPGGTPGEYFLIDVMTIEAIGQSDDKLAAVIFCPKRFYRAIVTQEQLEASGVEDCATLCNTIIAYAATMANRVTFEDSDAAVDEGFTDKYKSGSATFHGDPDLPL